ncbi:MAG TPA: hypothetical protein VMU30_05260 [Bacteroidota bacterium]|nr:hypothetical protein [Bacteroidota bacterium]
MNTKDQQTEIPDRECQESLQQFQTVVRSLVSMTRQLIVRISTVDIDVINNTLHERQQLLNMVETFRNKFVQWKQEQRISDQWKQFINPLISELFHADEQLMIAVQQRKHDVVQQLALLHRTHNLERYVR